MQETLSNITRESDDSPQRPEAHLFRVLSASRPLSSPSRHVLRGITRVDLGRGDSDTSRRTRDALRIDLDDRWVSEHHARLSRTVGRWQIEDLGSKNGILINGVRLGSTVLSSGDIVEIGRTFLQFVMLTGSGGQQDAEAVEPLSGLETIEPTLARTLGELARVAASTLPLMILGPTGAGKELVARSIHAASARQGPFVPVNCGAIPRELVESTLFGHRRGAFSGAVADSAGLIRTSDRGTLFLDEIGDLPLAAQSALLRVLQDHSVTALGAERAESLDLRVICATNRDLPSMVQSAAFRADLFHRLEGVRVTLPALAERRADLGIIIAHLLRRLAPGRASSISLHPKLARAMLAYDWPGNVRELEQALARALALSETETLSVDHFPGEVVSATQIRSNRDDDDERRRALVAALDDHGGNIRAVARAMGKDPVQIRRWLKRFGIDANDFREDEVARRARE